MKQNYFIYTAYLSLMLIVSGCSNAPVTDDLMTVESNDLIQISKEQFDSDNMEIGELTTQLFEEHVACNGHIVAPPRGMASISTQIPGIVKSIHCTLGDYVKKGQVLCSLTSTDLIVLQQDFAETSANQKRLKSDYERSKALYEEKIGSEKDFIAIENQYKIETAKYQSLKLRLEMLELDVSKIENGELYSSFPLLAPISGYLTIQNIILGQFIKQQENIMEIIDVNQLQLQLSVFENDIRNICIGQNIQFYSLGETNNIYSATLSSIGKTIDEESKTIKCLAKMEDSKTLDFINNTYIEAKISINQTEARALPSEAILKSGQDYYVFVLDKSDDQNYYLRKVNIKIGSISKGFTEIIGDAELANVITQGVYNLSAE